MRNIVFTVMGSLRMLGIGRYRLPSLKGCPSTNHNMVRQICADNDLIVHEECVTKDPRGDIQCPQCLHGIAFHNVFCKVEYIQTDIRGIRKHEECFASWSLGISCSQRGSHKCET
jgi:hypothetical protein